MVNCTKRIEFDAAHRLLNHAGNCANLHGHRYKIEFEAWAQEKNELGMCIDFSVLKTNITQWINSNWDHNVVLNKDDSAAIKAIELINKKKPYLMNGNPTAENMAEHLIKDICPKLFEGGNIRIWRVRVFETPSSWAEART
jgi:6-pyruvoyltetrahydropterin/6-carboxytetrahydropterin synthase